MSISSTGLYGSATIVDTSLFDDVETLKEEMVTLSTSYLQTTNEHRIDISQNSRDISKNLSKINDISTNKIPATIDDITDLSNNKIPALEDDVFDISTNKIPAIIDDITDLSNNKIPALEDDVFDSQENLNIGVCVCV